MEASARGRTLLLYFFDSLSFIRRRSRLCGLVRRGRRRVQRVRQDEQIVPRPIAQAQHRLVGELLDEHPEHGRVRASDHRRFSGHPP